MSYPILRLERAIAHLSEAHESPPDWQARVFEQISRETAYQSPWRGLVLAIILCALAVAITVILTCP